MFVCPFPTNSKFWKIWVFFFFFFLIFNFAFSNKIVKIKVSKYIVTVPKVNCVGTEGICLPIHVSTRLFEVTYLNTENYICISLTSRYVKKKKKKDRSTYRSSKFSCQKGKPTFSFFRPYVDKNFQVYTIIQRNKFQTKHRNLDAANAYPNLDTSTRTRKVCTIDPIPNITC